MSPKTLGMIRITRSPNTNNDNNAWNVRSDGDLDNNNNVNNNSYGRRPALILFYIRDLSNWIFLVKTGYFELKGVISIRIY